MEPEPPVFEAVLICPSKGKEVVQERRRLSDVLYVLLSLPQGFRPENALQGNIGPPATFTP